MKQNLQIVRAFVLRYSVCSLIGREKYLEIAVVCLTRLNFVVLFHRSFGYKCKIKDNVLNFSNAYVVLVCMNSKDIERTYHLTTRLSDGDAGDIRTFRKQSALTIGGRSQQIADTHATVIRIQGVSFYTQQKMAVLYISAAPINKYCKTLPTFWT
jgi:hypothetical protein